MVERAIVEAYQASRKPGTNTSVLCHAPFISLNFAQSGAVTVCCYNREWVLGTYPEQNVREIWAGAKAQALREKFLNDEAVPECELCFHQLRNRNFDGALMRNYDRYSREADAPPELEPAVPRVLEFEIANTCNLECVMCSGDWSSAIRSHRDKLPPLRSPYDDVFVRQLEEFLPSIVAAKFLGGEPFLIERYYEIWEHLSRSNPDAEVSITTNGTVLPPRARELIEKLRVYPVVSLDSINPTTFEAIRKNARFDQVMAHVEYFLDYARRRGIAMSFVVCPMTSNWRELPDLARFCEERQALLHFNTVLRPVEASLGGLPIDALTEVIDYLDASAPSGAAPWSSKAWEGLVSELRGWRDDKISFARQCSALERGVRTFAFRHFDAGTAPGLPETFDRLVSPLVLSFEIARERARRGHWDLWTLLPKVPIAVEKAGDAPSTQDLVLAAHVIGRYLDEVEQGKPSDSEKLKEEQNALREYCGSRANENGPTTSTAVDLDLWVQELIRTGQVDRFVLGVQTLLSRIARPDVRERWRVELDEGFARLRRGGLDPAGSQRVAAHLDRLMAGRFDPWEITRSHQPPEPAAGPAEPHVRDLEDARRMMDAICLFHRLCTPSADHVAFRRRLDRCLAALASGPEASLRGLFQHSTPTQTYEFLAHASDEEVERALEQAGFPASKREA